PWRRSRNRQEPHSPNGGATSSGRRPGSGLARLDMVVSPGDLALRSLRDGTRRPVPGTTRNELPYTCLLPSRFQISAGWLGSSMPAARRPGSGPEPTSTLVLLLLPWWTSAVNAATTPGLPPCRRASGLRRRLVDPLRRALRKEEKHGQFQVGGSLVHGDVHV